jgi:hypothetical protein
MCQNFLSGFDTNSVVFEGHKTDSDEGYADYHLDEDWDEGQKTLMDMGPLQIDTDVLGHDSLDIPSPTCKFVPLYRCVVVRLCVYFCMVMKMYCYLEMQ